MDIEIVKFFNKLCHNNILDIVPFSSKYKCLLKLWLIVFEERGNVIKRVPTKSVSMGFIVELICCNFVFDGLQDHMEQALQKSVSRLTGNEIIFLTKKLGTSSVYHKINHPVKVFCMRYIDDICVFGKFSRCQAKFLQSALEIFLIDRGLKMKDFNSKVFITYRPGKSFKYLGFKFVFPHIRAFKLNHGRFTKQKITPTMRG